MFFSNKEKKIGGSRVLTEAEIKKKLYGDFETTSADSHSSTQEVKMSGAAFENQAVNKRTFSSGAAIRSPSFGAASKPETLSARSVSPSFSDASSRKNPMTSPQGAFSTSSKNQFSFDWKEILLVGGKTVLGILTSVLWKMGSYLAQALEFVLRILDPRKPQARKLLYSITACLLVAALFFGVFRLNAQRKRAMSGELRKESSMTDSSGKLPSLPPSKPLGVISAPSVDAQPQSSMAESQSTDSKTIQTTKSVNPQAPTLAAVSQVPVTSGKYVIQVATYAALEDANHVIHSIEQAGFTAFTKKQMRNSTGHTFYPVYLGRYETFVTAQQTLSKFRKSSVARPFQDSFVRTLE